MSQQKIIFRTIIGDTTTIKGLNDVAWEELI